MLAAILAELAAKVGAPIIKDILEQQVGGKLSEVGGQVIDVIAANAGTNAEGLPEIIKTAPETVDAAILAAEANHGDRWLEMVQAANEAQFKLALAETEKGGWTSAWRPLWMYLIGFFWFCLIVLVPVINLFLPPPGITLVVSIATVLTLTSWFLALYMGGHTIKELGSTIRDAVVGFKK